METQETIGTWAKETFPGGDDLGPQHALRLLEEVVELCVTLGATRDDLATLLSTTAEKAYREALKADRPLEEAEVAEEMADCVIVLCVLAHRRGVGLGDEVERKMAINRGRKWQAHGDGTGHHIPNIDVLKEDAKGPAENRDWLIKKAQQEDNQLISVGGLAQKLAPAEATEPATLKQFMKIVRNGLEEAIKPFRKVSYSARGDNELRVLFRNGRAANIRVSMEDYE